MAFGDLDPQDPIEISDETQSANRADLVSRLATPVDRFAAFLADLVLFSPIAALIVAPFRRQALEAQLIGREEAWFIAMIGSACAGILSFVVYQTAFIYFSGATPGKKALGLKVESIWGADVKLTALSTFLRSLTFCLEAACLGFPWLAIYGNERRRSFHDRIADTIVVAGPRRRRAGPPTIQEISFASGCAAALLTVASLVLTYQILLYQRGSTGAKLISELEQKGSLCEEVGASQKNWIPEKDGKSPSRLAVAASLYEAGVVDEECLKLEADFSLWRPGDKALSYLARALSEDSDPGLAETYFDKVCDEKSHSDACLAANLLREPEAVEPEADEKAAIAERETQLEQTLSKVTAHSEPYLKLIAIQRLREMDRFEEALSMVDQFPPQKPLGGFLASERAKLLWDLEKFSDAHLVMRTAVDGLGPSERVDLTRWFCTNETWRSGCTSEAKTSCDLLSAAIDTDDELLKEPMVAAAYVRGVACEDKLDSKKLSNLEKRLAGEDSKAFVRALGHLAKNERQKAVDLFRALASGESEDESVFAVEATAKLISIAETADELKWVRQRWIDLESEDEGWDKIGRNLIKRFNAMKKWDDSIEVGLKLKDADAIDATTAKDMVVAAFRSGSPAMALHYLEQTKEFSELPGSSRSPASTDEFSDVMTQLQNSPERKHR